MKEATKMTAGLEGSKHATRQLSEEDIDWIVKEIGLEEREREEEDRAMEKDKKDSRSNLFNAPQDSRNALGLVKSILKNNKVVEEFKGLPKTRKWWKPAKNANLAKRLILAARDIIEGRYWTG